MSEGLVYPDGSFKSREEIRKKLVDNPHPIIEAELPSQKSYQHWLRRASEHSEEMQKDDIRTEGTVNVYLPATAILSMIGDLHYGGPEVDYKRFEKEMELITNTANSYVMLMGDLVDGFFWGGTSQSEQSANLQEQYLFLSSLFRALKDKALVAVSGEHDSKWASRSGIDPYSQFHELTGGAYVRGIAEINLDVDGEKYKITTQHGAKGHSLYNKAHPGMRNAVFNIQGAENYNSAHTHQKSISVQSIREHGEKAHEVVYGVVGPYKRTDDYAERKGYIPQVGSELGGYSILFDSTSHKMQPELDISFAHRKWG